MAWFATLFPSPDVRKPLTLEVFLKELAPVFVLYYINALLVLIDGTLIIRLALSPITLWLAFCAATQLDVAAGLDPRFAYLNQGLVLAMTTLGMRAVIWACQVKPYRRCVPSPKPKSRSPPNGKVPDVGGHLVHDSLDLCFNSRGHGWNWSDGLYVPVETRPLSRASFALYTFAAFVAGTIVFDCLHIAVQWFDPTFALATGGSIFDMSLPPIQRYMRSTMITLLGGLVIYTSIQLCYHIGTLVGVLVLRQHPSQWPPLFEYPWKANSLSDFWAKYWHQVFRQCFIFLGSKPMRYIMGRTGAVMGAFFVSAMLHYLALWGMGKGTEFWTLGTFFMMMGVGVILEGMWKELTGYRVGGILGKVWAAIWLVSWGQLLIDAYCRKGVVASVFFPEEYRPSLILWRLIHRGST